MSDDTMHTKSESMTEHTIGQMPVSRRAVAAAGVAAGLTALVAPAFPAWARAGRAIPATLIANRSGKGAPALSVLDTVITYSKIKQQTLTSTVRLRSYNETDSRGMPRKVDFSITSGTFVFPVLKNTASSWTNLEEFNGELQWNQHKADVTPRFMEGRQSDARFGLWEVGSVRGQQAQLKVNTPVLAWDTIFDEKTVWKFPWPENAWPTEAALTFGEQPGVDVNTREIQETLKKWTSDKDPKSIPPVQLAKYLMGKVIEHVQVTGNGLKHGKRGGFEGFETVGSAQAVREGKGTPFDLTLTLLAFYRAAGLPSRMVLGYDKYDESSKRLASWVEFCLYDEKAEKILWIPVNPALYREKAGSKARPLDQEWRFFGSNRRLHETVPFAFHLHPPIAGVVAHGAPACWGWFTTPTSQIAEQDIQFDVNLTARRTNDLPDTGDFVLPMSANDARAYKKKHGIK